MDKIEKHRNKFHQKKKNKYFQYAVTVALNFEKIRQHPEKITKTKLFINKYQWEGISFSSEKKKMIEKYFEENNVTIALNILYDTKRKKTSCLHFKT